MASTPPAGWYPDPAGGKAQLRYYDGAKWTQQTMPRPGAEAAPAPAAAPAPPVVSPQQAARPPRRAHLSTPPALPPAAVAPGTAQAMLLEDVKGWRPKFRPKAADPGWYSDPGRSGKLRFYDGAGWTPRTRIPVRQRRRRLPDFAIRLHAHLLEAADGRAVKTKAAVTWRNHTFKIARPQALPSQRRAGKSRSNQMGYGLSVLGVLVAVVFLGNLAWAQYGAHLWQDHTQDNLRAELVEEFDSEGGDFGVTYAPTDPAPVDVTTARPAPAKPTQPAQPRPEPAPRLNVKNPDIVGFPPPGWEAPANRRVRNLSGYANGEAVGRILIPRIGVDEVMVAGTGFNDLAKGPGVGRYGMLPGSPGNAIVAGHRTGWGEPFRNVDQLKYGDQIIVEIPGQQRAVYEVRSKVIVSPSDTDVLRQTDGVRLTLTTCHPVSVNTHRMILQAEMVEGEWLDRAVNRSKFRTIS